MSEVLDEELRAVGFTAMARDFPRDEMALAMFAAFNGTTPDMLPKGFKFYPNESTMRAWGRVAEAAWKFMNKGTEDDPPPSP